ncbi:MAG: 6,7-dimethyl-8-ribityllumazine synthase [Rhodospirillaceae bacterium]|nr:6,7-dimethyl-8-ribityllumazine synthase [Rhodospirillaceae bacterium]
MATPHILIIEARFYDDNADLLLEGAKKALKKTKAKVDVITVPGILELPAALAYAFSKGRKSAKKPRYAGAVVLGCAVKGETDHYEHVCRESMSGVQQVALELKVPVGNGILTCPTWDLAQNRADPAEGDAGGRAARACLRLIELKHRFGL